VQVFRAEARGNPLLVIVDGGLRLGKHLAALRRGVELLAAAVLGRALAHDQAAFFQAVDDGHHGRAIHSELVGEVDLGYAAVGVDQPENPGLLLGEVEPLHCHFEVPADGDIGHPKLVTDHVVETIVVEGVFFAGGSG